MKNTRYLYVLIGMVMLFTQKAFSQVQTARYISITPNTNAFYEYLPQGFSATATQKYPFILFLHGMGELGDGSASKLPLVLRNGPPKLINQGTFPTSFTVNGQTFRFVVLSPQFINWPTSADVDAVISYAINNYNVDPSRVYVTGLSMGGGATWEYAGDENNANYPKRVAAISPIAGASYPSTWRAQIISTNKIAVWAFHNDGDPTAPVWYTNDYVNYINATNPAIPAKKTIFNSTSHDAWTKAYDPNYRENGMNVYEWMLQYSKGSVPPPTNTPPTVNAGADQSITLPTSSVQLNGTASDPGGSIASYSWSKISGPSQFSFSSTSTASPLVSGLAQGTYTFRLTVTDNQGATATDDVNVTVNALPTAGTKYVKVNIFGGSNPYSDAQWNNWNLYSSLSSGNLKYSDGSSSNINASLSQQNSVSDNGTSFSTTMAPSEVMRYASYSTSNRTLTISGLDNSKTYNLELYAARAGASNNTTRFVIGSTTVDIKTDDNWSNKASFVSLVPSNGQITVNISKLNTYNYINGWTLTENGSSSTINTPPTVNAGTDQSITLPTSSVQLSATASDVGGSIASYSWSKISGPSQFTFSSTSIANPTVSNLAQGTYTFRLTVTDNQGATAYDDVNVVVNATTTSSPAKYVKVNIYAGSNAYNNTAWNNWSTYSSLSSGNLKYDDGSASSVNMSLSQQNSVSDNGTSFSTTMAPSEVIRYASYSTSNRTLTISGLDNSKTYNLELYAARTGATNNTTRFTIGSTVVDIKTDDNTSNKASFTSLVPSNGQITVNISKLNTYNYINGLMLTENASATVSATAKSTEELTAVSTAFNVYPNPVEDRFVLQLNNSNTGKMKVQVIDISGVIQKEFNLSKNQPGSMQTYLSIGDLKAGEYIIRVQIGEWIETKKISKF